MSKNEYTWNENKTDEVWGHDRFASIEECIQDAIEYGMVPGDTIAIGICEDYVPMIDASHLLDDLGEAAYEECGEVSESWLEFERGKGYKGVEQLQIELDKVLNKWLQDTKQVPSFYRVIPLAELETIPEEN